MAIPFSVIQRALQNRPNSNGTQPKFGTFAWKMQSFKGASATVALTPEKVRIPGPLPEPPAIVHLGSYNLDYNEDPGTYSFPLNPASFTTNLDFEWIYAAYFDRKFNLTTTPCTLNIVLSSQNTNNFTGEFILSDADDRLASFDYQIIQSSSSPTSYPLTLRALQEGFDFTKVNGIILPNTFTYPGSATYFYLTTTYNPAGFGTPVTPSYYDSLFYYIDNTQPSVNLNNYDTYIIVNSAVSTFNIFFNNIPDPVTLTNNFNVNNFAACNLSINTTLSSISSNKSTLFIGSSAILSAINDSFYTLYYFNTGSLILGVEAIPDALFKGISSYPHNTKCLAPSAVYVTSISSQQVTLNWTTPVTTVSTGPILNYIVSYQYSNYPVKSKSIWVNYPIQPTTNTLTLTGLTVGWNNFRVATVTQNGQGQFSVGLSSTDTENWQDSFWTQGVYVPLTAAPIEEPEVFEPLIYSVAAAGNNEFNQLGI